MHLFSLKGDVAMVTGAASGIGQAIAAGLAEAGADVALFDLPSQADGLAETSAMIEAHGTRSLVTAGDVTSEQDLAAAVASVEAKLGQLTVAVNAAGIAAAAPAEDLTPAAWNRILDVNLTGIFLSCQAEARVMLGRPPSLLPQAMRRAAWWPATRSRCLDRSPPYGAAWLSP